tara:strand:+ start:15751 stop:19902 length:4152 start_codon:yes stop_codon:yes gene_type:complete
MNSLINISQKLSQLIKLIDKPIKQFNFFWLSAETDDDIHYYNTNLFDSLKSKSNLFCFYINFASKPRTNIITTYIDIINKLLTQNRTLSARDYLLLKQKLSTICDSTQYFKLFINDNLQKIQLSYNVIYDDYKYEHHNFNYHLSVILKCISEFYSICLIIENGHLLERHVVMLLSSFLLSQPSLTVVFTFPNYNLSLYPSLNEFFSLIKLNNYLTKDISLPSINYHDILVTLKSFTSISHLDALSLASLILKKSSRSIFLINFFLNNLSFLESDFVSSRPFITRELLIHEIFNGLSEATKHCMLLACLEDSPFNLYEICRFYDYDYSTIKNDALNAQFILPEHSFSNLGVIRDHYFQFASISIISIILDGLSKKQLTQIHNDHISYSIQSKKTISYVSTSFIIDPSNNYQFPKTISKDFFSQLVLEAYSSIHLEQHNIAHDFFFLLLNYFKNNFIHSKLFHFDIAYHHLLCKLYSNHSDIQKEWQNCFLISTNNKERALLHLFKMKWLHQKQFNYYDLTLEATQSLAYLNINLGFIPSNKFFLTFKFGIEFLKLSIWKLKKFFHFSKSLPTTSSEILIIAQVLNLLVLNAPLFLLDLMVFIKERIINQANIHIISIDLLDAVKKMKSGDIKKLDILFQEKPTIDTTSFKYDRTDIYTFPDFIKTLFYTPLKYNLEKSTYDIKTFLNNKLTLSSSSSHYWLACINFHQNFQLLNGVSLQQIQQSYDLNIFFFLKTCHLSSSIIISHTTLHKQLLTILAENQTFDCHTFINQNKVVLESNESAEPILKFLIMFICFYKQDYKSAINIGKNLENKFNNYLLGIFYPLFCFYYSLSLFFDYKLTSTKDPASLQLLFRHIDIFNHLITQDLHHYKPYYNILKSIQNYYHSNKNSHRLILETIESSDHYKQPLANLIAHEIAAIFYHDLHDKDGVQKHIDICIKSYDTLGYCYKRDSLSKHYHFYLSKDTKPLASDSEDNIVFLLKNKKNVHSITDIELSYMFQFIFRYIDFDSGYFFKSDHEDLILNYTFLSKDVSLAKDNTSITTFPPFIQTHCNQVFYSQKLFYQSSSQLSQSGSPDSYILDHNIDSILVIPLLTPAQSVSGILYFENKTSQDQLSQSQLENLYNYIHLFELIIHNNSLLHHSTSKSLSFNTNFQNFNSTDSDLSHKLSQETELNMITDLTPNKSTDSSNYFNSLKAQLTIIASSILNNDSFSPNSFSSANISSLLNYAITIIQPECRKRSIKIHTELSDISDSLLDFSNMILIFFNIIIHSIESINQSGSIFISSSVCSQHSEDSIIISFTDTSNTLDKDLIDLFLHNETSRNTVTLSMLIPIIDALKGTIYISSDNDHSTYLTISIPLIRKSNTQSNSNDILSSLSDKSSTIKT